MLKWLINSRLHFTLLHEECCHESENCVELRISCKNHGVGLEIVSLADTYDTVCTNLALTDTGEEADKANAKAYAEEEGTVGCYVLAENPEDKCEEAVQTLGSGHGGENHVAREFLRCFFHGALCSIAGDSCADCAADTGEAKHEPQSEIT